MGDNRFLISKYLFYETIATLIFSLGKGKINLPGKKRLTTSPIQGIHDLSKGYRVSATCQGRLVRPCGQYFEEGEVDLVLIQELRTSNTSRVSGLGTPSL